MTALVELVDTLLVGGGRAFLVKVNGKPAASLSLVEDVELTTPILERLGGHMVCGRANASAALDAAALRLSAVADTITNDAALPGDEDGLRLYLGACARSLRDAACAARVAAVNVRKEIPQ